MSDVGGIAGERLRSFIERIEQLHSERTALADDIAEVFSEAKGAGFNVKVMREVLKIRRMDPDDLDEHEALLDLYLRAIRHKPEHGTPLANIERARVPARHDAESGEVHV